MDGTTLLPSAEILTIPVKYLFLDIVSYSKNRSVEAQCDIIKTLNTIVSETISANDIPDKNRIFLPTGDGICIALLSIEIPYDVHIKIALEIMARLNNYNSRQNDRMRQFSIRLGINENVDNLVTDINASRNLAGAGINMAQRVMDSGSAGTIMVSERVYTGLQQREKYMHSFKEYKATIKHGYVILIYQFIEEGHPGVSIAKTKDLEEAVPRLTTMVAYYFAHAIKNRGLLHEFIKKTKSIKLKDNIVVFLWFLANDSLEKSISPVAIPRGDHATLLSLEKQISFYSRVDSTILYSMRRYIIREELLKYENCFDKNKMELWFSINAYGMEKLKTELPVLWEGFDLEKYSTRIL